MHTKCSHEALVGYLYDELEGADRAAFESHLASCAACRDELQGLGATRSYLTSWAPPEPEFGFRIVRGAAAPPERRSFWRSPAWGLAAAATLLLALASAIAQVEVRYGAEGLVVRTGWARTPSPGATQAGIFPAGGAASIDWKPDVSALDRRLVALERSAAAPASAVSPGPASGMSDAEFIRRVREMIAQSELRQQRLMNASLGAFAGAVDRQRRYDQQQVTGANNRTKTELFNYLLAVSTPQPPSKDQE